MTSNVIACFRYKDAPAAVEWLCKAFGFERHLIVPDDKGGIAHAELKFGGGMIMLGTAREDAFGELVKPASGGAVTSSVYIVVQDVDEHYRRAQAAGAMILKPPKDEDYGGRDYTCRDPQGYIWDFGDYDPWQPPNK
jgi:uncharacterized glyoxalase superfamily protein PhnB